MITLSNGHAFQYMVASGALAYDGKGYLWERPLVWTGLIKPELFTVVTKTLTHKPCDGHFRWWKPWESVRLIRGGTINKFGLRNPGIDWWCRKVGPRLDYKKIPLVVSIFGEEKEMVEMAMMLDHFDLAGIEVNVSCPNFGHPFLKTSTIVQEVKAVKESSRHPIIVKVSVTQDYLCIARRLVGIAEAVSLNSVPWEVLNPLGQPSPLRKLEERVGGGGGGVSGRPAQKVLWPAVKALARQGWLPVIGPSIMEYEDLDRLRKLGASACSFGSIHLRTPWKPTEIVLQDMQRQV